MLEKERPGSPPPGNVVQVHSKAATFRLSAWSFAALGKSVSKNSSRLSKSPGASDARAHVLTVGASPRRRAPLVRV